MHLAPVGLGQAVAGLLKMPPALVMLAGVTGAGKSTFAEEIRAATPDVLYLSGDDRLFAKARAAGIGYAEAYKRFNAETIAEVEAEAAAALAAGRSVLWDQTNLTPEIRGKRRALAPKDVACVCVVFEVDAQEQSRRLSERAKTETEAKPIPAFALEAQRAQYVRPALAEGFDRVFVVSASAGGVDCTRFAP